MTESLATTRAGSSLPDAVWQRIERHAPRLLMLDFDGTLAPFEVDREFGGLGFPAALPAAALIPAAKGRPGENTTIAVVATDAALTKAQTKELAVMAQDGLARALYPAHTTLDGDTVFAVATGRRPLADAVNELAELGAVAANTLARAVARGVFEAKALPGGPPSWQDCHSK